MFCLYAVWSHQAWIQREFKDVYGLGKLLHHPELKKILGNDIAFDLQGLLVKSETGVGDNLRNRMAHGLMDDKDFFRTDAIYLWWLALHLLVRFQIARDSRVGQSQS